ncbi:hypothetical protein [Gordonia liuliyuniae]|uniref:Uncharacterized protein n=1 Tax=Gordonia liuliyuniae TaxID=2911517 RepID=A0ABS9IV51_9ACTN|nr:hypothetical protein [Gordonia liuliyuniae]MCF8589443.1 hypothetical protein [Gordonia liuliyuniae]
MIVIGPFDAFEDDESALARYATDVLEQQHSRTEQEAQPGTEQRDRRPHQPSRPQESRAHAHDIDGTADHAAAK